MTLLKMGGKLLKTSNLARLLFGEYVYLGQYVTNRNFGDALGYLLAKELKINGGRVIPQRHSFDFAYHKGLNLQFVGSTLADTDSKSIIIGAGAVSADTKIREKPMRVYSVRGPLTRQLLIEQGIECPEVYGDPAVLLPLLYKPQVRKKYKIGLIPHYVDQTKPQVKELLESDDVHFIDILLSPSKTKPSIMREWKQWIDELCSCEVVVSSSLHGLIIADAYNIPTVWVKFGDDINGNDFKYYDYYASLGLTDIQPTVMLNNVLTPSDLSAQATTKDVSTLQQALKYLFELDAKKFC